ncbi:MAG TPA: hypothetical protein VIL20_21290 [Sandaracinaceae bacterium]
MKPRRTYVVPFAVVLALSLPAAASADEPAAPEHRFDVLTHLGYGYFDVPASSFSTDDLWTFSLELRYAHASGHGALLRGTWGVVLDFPSGEGYGVELDYLGRVPIAGDEDLSLALDVTVGGTVAGLDHGSQRIPTGAHLGGNAGLTLDLRAYNFVASVGACYRLLVPLEERLDGEPAGPAHLVTAVLGLGFTFY